MVAETAKTPADQWGPIYVSLLKGYAATIAIAYLEDTPNATYDQLSSHVCDTLERQHVAADKTALEVRTLGPTEDLGDYANSLRVLTRRAYGHVYKPQQVEERAGEAFGRGLTGPLKQRVREEFKDSLDAALQLARNLEAVGVSRVTAAVAPVTPAPKATAGAGSWGNRGPAPGSRTGGYQGNKGFPKPQGSLGSFQGGAGAKPKTGIECWFCGNKGHTKAECRKKAAADAAAGCRNNQAAKNGGESGGGRPPE